MNIKAVVILSCTTKSKMCTTKYKYVHLYLYNSQAAWYHLQPIYLGVRKLFSNIKTKISFL